jgi:hypothetical protein
MNDALDGCAGIDEVVRSWDAKGHEHTFSSENRVSGPHKHAPGGDVFDPISNQSEVALAHNLAGHPRWMSRGSTMKKF